MRRKLGFGKCLRDPKRLAQTVTAIWKQNRSAHQECGDTPACAGVVESVHRLVHLKVSRENHDLFDLDAVISADQACDM
jgi:hypothetical protein